MRDQDIDRMLKDFARQHLSPTREEQDYVATKYHQLKEFLGQSCFKSGSFARFTAIHPMHDLDVIWVTYNPAIMDDPEGLLRELAADLTRQYRGTGGVIPKISIQTHSVTLTFSDRDDDFSIDVVPAVPSSEPSLTNEYDDHVFIVPEVLKMNHSHRQAFYASHGSADDVSWVYTDPKGYIKHAKALDDDSGGNHRKAAKILKAWRHARKEDLGDMFKLKSFHTEQVCAEMFAKNPSMTVYEALRACFNILADYVVAAPYIEDRAYALTEETKYIDEYLGDESSTKADKELILAEIASAAKTVSSLAGCSRDAEVLAAIKQLVTAMPTQPTPAPARVAYAEPARPWL
jgi:hypothetical protein